ncbi:DUF2271 domain-containing protein [Stenotrophobium rhamnosiphilum]|uniref:DUF2271 domain-containing protein n=1 Tax=Stenotrophobium rhamnosiphilum TaxID=2029166 RepID=A0A2T5MKV4_9GAMM|nr:DUF2271 domain-containing protein [Stenotrophobium rhamnosiphilum]PTU33194.1 DUF2271 domain-containing protein [Stenotrophobium rhamnosiphilum]
MRHRIPFALCAALLPGTVLAANLNVSIEVPRIDVAEYHRPYVAVWLEREDKSVAANLSVWYQQKKAAPAATGGAPAAAPNPAGGVKWLPDLRQWWRRSGRELQLPVDGVSGATRAPGEHALSFNSDKGGALANLPAGQYKLVVESAREEGGRELIDIPFQWPVKQAQQLKAKGERELGAIVLDVKP